MPGSRVPRLANPSRTDKGVGPEQRRAEHGGMGSEKDVAGRTIVITGASSGFGRGAAARLAELGAQVVVAARRGAVLEELVEEISASGGSALAVETDVSDP